MYSFARLSVSLVICHFVFISYVLRTEYLKVSFLLPARQ